MAIKPDLTTSEEYDSENVKTFLNDNGPLTNRTSKFFMYKTIQRSYDFLVMFDEESWFDNLGFSTFHATSITIPDYQFEREKYEIGPFVKTFPVLNHEGMTFDMTLEEDDSGRVKNLIHCLVRNNIKSSGYYNTFSNTIIDNIVVDVYRPDGTNIYKLQYKNCYFLDSSTPTYSFNTNEKIEYTLKFNCSHYRLIPHYGAVYTEEDAITGY